MNRSKTTLRDGCFHGLMREDLELRHPIKSKVSLLIIANRNSWFGVLHDPENLDSSSCCKLFQTIIHGLNIPWLLVNLITQVNIDDVFIVLQSLFEPGINFGIQSLQSWSCVINIRINNWACNAQIGLRVNTSIQRWEYSRNDVSSIQISHVLGCHWAHLVRHFPIGEVMLQTRAQYHATAWYYSERVFCRRIKVMTQIGELL